MARDYDSDTHDLDALAEPHDLDALAEPLYAQALDQIAREEARRKLLADERSGADVRMLLIIALVSLLVALGLYALGLPQ